MLAARMRGTTDKYWWIGVVVMLVAAIVLLTARPFADDDDSSGLSEVPRGQQAEPAKRPGDEGVRDAVRAHDENGGGRLVGGSVQTRLAGLKAQDTPVVVNQWASWCAPCQAEFPIFAEVSEDLDERVAFIGLNSRDNGDPEAFLSDHPVSYPNLKDPKGSQAIDIGAGRSFPSTVFYDRKGKRTFVKQGGYATEDALERDVRRYALGEIPVG